jgi:hypothetical protein
MFQKLKPKGSLTLSFFKKTGTGGSLILKILYKKKPELDVITKSKTTHHWFLGMMHKQAMKLSS